MSTAGKRKAAPTKKAALAPTPAAAAEVPPAPVTAAKKRKTGKESAVAAPTPVEEAAAPEQDDAEVLGQLRAPRRGSTERQRRHPIREGKTPWGQS